MAQKSSKTQPLWAQSKKEAAADWYDVENADKWALEMEEPQHHEKDPAQEVATDDNVYTIGDDGKTLKKACSYRGLPASGTKKKRLHNFKLNMKWEFEAGIANKNQWKPNQIKIPKMPVRGVQDHPNETHMPSESWCEACLATRSKEDGYKLRGHKDKVVLAIDFACTFENENYQSVPSENLKPEDYPEQYRTMLNSGHHLGTTSACKRLNKPKALCGRAGSF